MRLLRTEEVAALLGISRAWVYELVRRGEIPYVKMGKRAVRFPAEELEAWVAARKRLPKVREEVGVR